MRKLYDFIFTRTCHTHYYTRGQMHKLAQSDFIFATTIIFFFFITQIIMVVYNGRQINIIISGYIIIIIMRNFVAILCIK